MPQSKVDIETKGIKRALKGFSTYESISEYIWNGFDAEATKVSIKFNYNNLERISDIIVHDNGYGISKSTLQEKFTPIFESRKLQDLKRLYNSSVVHGRNGVGRFTFFTFCDRAKWTTVYEKNGKRYLYNIEIDANELNTYFHTEEVETTKEIGTSVHFLNFDTQNFIMKDFFDYLVLEFSWYLELNKENGCEIYIDGKLFRYANALQSRTKKSFVYTENTKPISFDVIFCCWNIKLHEEYSKYYYINSFGKEVYKENTTLNNKGDKFYHSVFIKSEIFNDFIFEKEENQMVLSGYSKDTDEFKFINTAVDKYLRKLRHPFIKEFTKKYVGDLKKTGAYPNLNQNNIIDRLREKTLDEMISVINMAEPRIFSGLNLTQQKTLVRLLDFTVMSGDKDSLYLLLENILDMETTDRNELAKLLEYTTLTNIKNTITLIQDRLMAISHLKKLVLDESLYTTEIDHIQPFIEKHYWLFGEQYYLVTAEEPDFEEALRKFLYVLRGENKPRESIKIDNPLKNKEMDIFAIQRKLDGDIKKAIVVELKHPKKTLKMKELQQVKDYFGIITQEDRFNAANIEWVFYLIGNNKNHEIEDEIESHRNYGERSLVHNVRGTKIYVKTWSEIFTEHEINLNFLQEQLLINQGKMLKKYNINSADEIVREQNKSRAKRPTEIAIS